MYIYTVKPGDTLFDIAQKNGVTISALVAANQLSDPYKLPVGLALVIPGQSIRERSIVVNGYAFPGISDIALLGALQYLTYLSVFSAKTRIDGTITELNDTALIRKCYVNGVAPVLTLTNQRESGGFSGDIAHAVIADEEVKTKLIQNVMEYLDRRNYFGLNIDFEYVREEDRTLYTQFLLDFAAALRRVGYSLSVALAPKVSQEQSGLLYTAHDYGAVGSIADKVIIMTYEWRGVSPYAGCAAHRTRRRSLGRSAHRARATYGGTRRTSWLADHIWGHHKNGTTRLAPPSIYIR